MSERVPRLSLLVLCPASGPEATLESNDRALRFLPEDPGLLFDRACLLALTGEPGMALESLRRSLERQPDLRARALEDPDLESLRRREEFAAVVAADP